MQWLGFEVLYNILWRFGSHFAFSSAPFKREDRSLDHFGSAAHSCRLVGMENYERGEKLGEGAWGVVTSAVSFATNVILFLRTFISCTTNTTEPFDSKFAFYLNLWCLAHIPAPRRAWYSSSGPSVAPVD